MFDILKYFSSLEEYQTWEQYQKYYWFDPALVPSEYIPKEELELMY